MADTSSKKRRPRTGSNSPPSSGDDGKKRGRPRVEKQDESAADRRRTQIRMAQRAYRQRKESTLEELRKRVSELTNTLEMMNKTFIDCRDRLATAGLAEEYLQDLRETAIQYEALMKCARNPGEEVSPEVTSRLRRQSSGAAANESGVKDTEPKNVPSWMDETALNHNPAARPTNQLAMGYSMYPASGTQTPTDDTLTQSSQAVVTQQGATRSNSSSALQTPGAPSIPPALSTTMTYSFQETTFGRRLHRACLEAGYQLLLDPTRRPHTYERVFKLSLMSRDRNKLLGALKLLLDRGPHEPLDLQMPLIHVGGAGTHYPRRDQFGNWGQKKKSWNLGLVGPQTLALLENAARDNLTVDMSVDIAGFEGEWFDPYDVEGYLAEKGILIDPASSFAEAELGVWHNTPGSSAVSSMSIESDRRPPQPFDHDQLQSLSRGGFEPSGSTWNDVDMMNIMDISDIGFSDADTGSWMNFLQPGQSTRHIQPTNATTQSNTSMTWEGSRGSDFLQEPMQPGRMEIFQRPTSLGTSLQQKKSIIIDVAKFVKVMTVSGVCIGRSPGFKRRDVDRALALASFDAF